MAFTDITLNCLVNPNYILWDNQKCHLGDFSCYRITQSLILRMSWVWPFPNISAHVWPGAM